MLDSEYLQNLSKALWSGYCTFKSVICQVLHLMQISNFLLRFKCLKIVIHSWKVGTTFNFNISTSAERQNEKAEWQCLSKWLQRKGVEEEMIEDRRRCLDRSPRFQKAPAPVCAQQRIQSERLSV